jgi:hypothetical protein
MKNNDICIVGWYFWDKFYKKISSSKSSLHVVAHRYRETIENYNISYSVKKNIGLEYGAYDWYIKNKWNGKNNILFMHDDIDIKGGGESIDDLINYCNKFDVVHVTGVNEPRNIKYSFRCIYFSGRAVKQWLKDFNGFWYDEKNKGYTIGNKFHNDNSYKKDKKKGNTFTDPSGYNNKCRLKELCGKHKFKRDIKQCKSIKLHRRGGVQYAATKLISDQSIFNINELNSLNKYVNKIDVTRSRSMHYYIKWYYFYLSNIDNAETKITEINNKDKAKKNIWRYFFNKELTHRQLPSTEISLLSKKDKQDIIVYDFDSSIIKIKEFITLFESLEEGGVCVLENVHSLYKNETPDAQNIFSFITNLFFDEYRDSMGIESIHYYAGICFVFKKGKKNTSINFVDKIEKENKYLDKCYYYFDRLSKNNLNVLQINGEGRDSNMWAEYFCHSDIHFLSRDINKSGEINKNINIINPAKFSNKFVKNDILGKIKDGIDVIIDYEGFSNKDFIKHFKIFFKKMNPGSIYVIINKEDVAIDSPNKLFLLRKIDEINYSGKYEVNNFENIVTNSKNEKMSDFERILSSLHLYNDVFFIFKKYCK